MRPAPSPVIRALAALLLCACVGCGQDTEGETPSDAAPPTEAAPDPVPAAPAMTAEAVGSLAGTWWALSVELPYTGFRITLVDTASDDDAWEGSWISFDWRGTTSAGKLSRPSRAVAVTARRTQDQLVISGPAPQIDQSGVPLGAKGSWELTLKPASLPGEPLRFSGQMHNLRVTDDVAVELERDFRIWQP